MRLFVAISLSDELCNSIVKAQNELKNFGIRGNYSRTENLHLTLAFIGETQSAAKIKAALSEIEFAPFTLATEKLSAFGEVATVAVSKNGELSALRKSVVSALRSVGVEISGKFSPHITLAREIRNLPTIDIEKRSMQVNAIDLFKSERIDGRLVYTSIYKVFSLAES